jgi:hypothetical protein
LLKARVSLRPQPFDQNRYLVETGAEFRLGFIYRFRGRAGFDGVFICRHGNAKGS